MFNEQTFYSDDRDLNFECWLVLAESQKVKGKKGMFDHVCGASPLFKRSALNELLQAMSRKDFKDWTKPLGFEGAGSTHNNYRLEMRQWFSGSPLYLAILTSLTQRVSKREQPRKGGAQTLFQVRDYTAYDDELLQAVAKLNSSSGQVVYAYHASCWHQATANQKVVNQENLLAACRDHVRTKIQNGSYDRARLDMSKFGPEPTAANVASGQKVDSKAEDYELCYPKEGGELPLRQTTMAVGAGLGSVAVLDPANPERSWTFETLVQAHNAEFNPTGLAWSTANPNKRAAAESSSGPPACAEELSSKLPAPVDLDKFAKVVPGAAQYDLLVDQHGSLYIHALQDGMVSEEVKFAKVTGSFIVGAPAKALMGRPGAQYIPYSLLAGSRVLLTQKPADSGSSGPVVDLHLPGIPVTLEAAFDILAAKKQGKVELHKHTVQYQPGGGEPMQVAADDDCCLQVAAAQTAKPGSEVPVDKLAAALQLGDLAAAEVLHQLQYDPALKRLKPMLPVVVPKGPFLLKQGTCYKL